MEQDFKIGILCDNYKLEKFKLELVLKGYISFKLVPNPKNETTCILIDTTPKEVQTIQKICFEVEEHFRAQKN